MGNQYQTVVVRPKISSTDEDPVAKALAHFKMSKFAGCADNFIGAAYDRKLGRYLTGLDENHPEILTLPQDKRAARQKEIIEEREFLEQELGVDLKHTNTEFWSTIPIVLDGSRVFDTSIPLDHVIVKAIEAGKMVPTSKEDINDPAFKSAHFYLGKEYEDVEEKTNKRDRERKVILELTRLLENFDYAIQVGQYLGISGISEKMPKANLDDLLSEFLERKTSNKDLFLDTMKEKQEYVRLFNQFRDFKVKGLVRFEDSSWKSGKLKLGKTEKEAVRKLLSANPEMQAELSRLIEDYKELTQK